MNKKIWGFVVVVAVICAAGCSGNKQVKGKVTLTDGTPVTRGDVVFDKGTFSARGEIKPDGSYVMGSLKENDGVPPGEYTVYITGATQTGNSITVQSLGGGGQMQTLSIPTLTPVIADRYTSAEKSDLKCNVTKSMTFDIKVDPAGM